MTEVVLITSETFSSSVSGLCISEGVCMLFLRSAEITPHLFYFKASWLPCTLVQFWELSRRKPGWKEQIGLIYIPLADYSPVNKCKPAASMPMSILRPVLQILHHSAYGCSLLSHPSLQHTVIQSDVHFCFRKASSVWAVAAERKGGLHFFQRFFNICCQH